MLHRFGTGNVREEDRHKISEHTLLVQNGPYHLTYHEFNRLHALQYISACPNCTEMVEGEIIYHPHTRLPGSPDTVTTWLFGLLQEPLH